MESTAERSSANADARPPSPWEPSTQGPAGTDGLPCPKPRVCPRPSWPASSDPESAELDRGRLPEVPAAATVDPGETVGMSDRRSPAGPTQIPCLAVGNATVEDQTRVRLPPTPSVGKQAFLSEDDGVGGRARGRRQEKRRAEGGADADAQAREPRTGANAHARARNEADSMPLDGRPNVVDTAVGVAMGLLMTGVFSYCPFSPRRRQSAGERSRPRHGIVQRYRSRRRGALCRRRRPGDRQLVALR